MLSGRRLAEASSVRVGSPEDLKGGCLKGSYGSLSGHEGGLGELAVVE